MVMLCWCLQGTVSWSSHAVDVVVVVDVFFLEAFLVLSDAIIFDWWTELPFVLVGKVSCCDGCSVVVYGI